MAALCETNYAYNTVIFNWVKDYGDQVTTLKSALESLQNKVQIYNNLTSKQLAAAVDKLRQANFELYNYIAVIILDNESEFQQFIKTSDNQYVLLNSEIVTRIQTNSTLNDIPRLIVIQKLLDIRDIEDEDVNKIEQMVTERQAKLQQLPTLYPGLTMSIRADEYSKNFADSMFIKVFSTHIREKAKTISMDTILQGIMREIKCEQRHKINIEIGSNACTSTSRNLLFGNAVCGDVLRDFF